MTGPRRLAGRRWQLALVAAALALVVAGKQYYRHASAHDLRWILAPTAALVSTSSGAHFTYEAGTGWVDRDVAFIIAPACAGVNFALAAMLVLALGGLGEVRTGRGAARRLGGAIAGAYVATLIVNTVRITIAVALHQGAVSVAGLDGAELHRAEGIAVYLGGLCAVHAAARLLARAPTRPAAAAAGTHARRNAHALAG